MPEKSCSFCHMKESALTYEIAGKNLIHSTDIEDKEVYICLECVETCADIMRRLRAEERKAVEANENL